MTTVTVAVRMLKIGVHKVDVEDSVFLAVLECRAEGGRPMRIPVGGRGGFSLTTLLIIGVILFFFGINPLEILTGGMGTGGRSNIDIPQLPQSDQAGRTQPRGSGLDIPGLPGSRGSAKAGPHRR